MISSSSTTSTPSPIITINIMSHPINRSNVHLDTSQVSHYQTPISSPANSQPSPNSNNIDDKISLTSTQLDFTFNDGDENSEVLNKCHFYHQNDIFRSISHCTLVPERNNIPIDCQLSKIITDPFIDSFCENKTSNFYLILNNLEKLSTEFVKLQDLERQIMSVGLQLKSLQEKLFLQNRDSLEMVRKFVQHLESKSPKQSRDVQTQTYVWLNQQPLNATSYDNCNSSNLATSLESFNENFHSFKVIPETFFFAFSNLDFVTS